MAEDDQLQFLDSRVDYLEDVLKAIVEEYGADAVEIIPNVDIDTINALSDSAGKRRQFIEFLSSDGKLELKSKDAQGTIETQTLYQDSDTTDSLLITSKGQLKNLNEDAGLEDSLKKKVKRFGLGGDSPESSRISKESIRKIRQYMEVLGTVFGFNSPQDKEMFVAAWLSENTTTRLSGIPGTGKTTLIECAALLFGNSYGFIGDRKDPLNQIWNPNRTEAEVRDWEDRRFLENSYRYPFAFILNQYQGIDLNTVKRNSLKLFGLDAGFGGSLSNDYFHIAVEAMKRNMILLVDADSNPIIVRGASEGEYEEKDGWLRWPPKEMDKDRYDFYRCVPIESVLDKWNKGSSDEDANLNELYSKYGEGKLDAVMKVIAQVKNREMSERDACGLIYYDDRVNSRVGRGRIDSEMRNEIGMAKVDKDKRAEQLLYGVDITSEDAQFGDTAGLQYRFQPFPRPIVTQPIKFFNEVNRSQASVEDAILGLIAEGEVEYRGEVFKSPSYTAFMDTNPHVGGNDLAFTDRIDMELLFPSALLDQRYKILMGRLDENATSEKPRSRILDMIISNQVAPLRYEELKQIWDNTKQVTYVKDGYNALMDISIISTLFSQRFGVHEPEAQIALSFQSENLIHNRKSGNYQNSLIPVNSSGYFIDASISESKTYRNDMEKSQQAINRGHGAMALMDRVLAMRFTNSLAKLARSLAYLRGNQYVTRKEVMDCLPYVVGHRMGRSKGDGGKMEYGLNQLAAAKFASGQEFVREAIVKGYIERALDSFGSLSMGVSGDSNEQEQRSQSRWVEWDSMLNQARKDLATSRTYAEYEMKMWAMGSMASGGGNPQNAAGTGDPMAYLIYRLVLMEELTRTDGDANLKQVTYGKLNGLDKDYIQTHTYNERIGFYQEQISELLTTTQNYTANDIGILRRKITLERWLTMGDKLALLNQIDSLLDNITGFQIPDLFGPQDETTQINSKIWGLYSACTQQIPDEYREMGLLDTTRVIGFPPNDFIRNPTWYGGSATGRASHILYAGQEDSLDKDAFKGLKENNGGEATTDAEGILTDNYSDVSYPVASKRNLEQTTSFQASIRNDGELQSALEIVSDFLIEIDTEFSAIAWTEMLEMGMNRTEEGWDVFDSEITRQIQKVYDDNDGTISKDYVIDLENEAGNFNPAIDFTTSWDEAATELINDDSENRLRFYVSLIGDAKNNYIRLNFCLASMNVILDSNGNLTPVSIIDEYPLGEGMQSLQATAANKETFFDLGNMTKLAAYRYGQIVKSKLTRQREE